MTPPPLENPGYALAHNVVQIVEPGFYVGGGGGGANEAKVDQTTEMYFLLSDPFI